jgi:hypothetical protein
MSSSEACRRAHFRLGVTLLVIGYTVLYTSLANADEPDLRLYGVNIFVREVKEKPPCQSEGSANTVRASNVGAFQRSVGLGNILWELARQAIASGNNTLYDIQITYEDSRLGVSATAKTAKCVQFSPPSDDRLPFDDATAKLLASASVAELFEFPRTDALPSVRTIEANKPVRVAPFEGKELKTFQGLILSPSSYVSGSIQTSCSFYPTVGLKFHIASPAINHAEELWYLLSVGCQTALVTNAATDWRKAPHRILSRDALGSLEVELAKIRKQK